jgi:hypothetical protein
LAFIVFSRSVRLPAIYVGQSGNATAVHKQKQPWLEMTNGISLAESGFLGQTDLDKKSLITRKNQP